MPVVERYDRWTGHAWLEIDGPDPHRIRIGSGHGAIRARARRERPEGPLVSDWSDGRFAASPWGLPSHPLLVFAVVVGGVATVGAAFVFGPVAAGLVAAACGWSLSRLVDAVWVTPLGVRAGPPWALRVPWHDVRDVGFVRRGRAVEVWVIGRTGAGAATVPPVLLPAVRAAFRLRGGRILEEREGGLDLRYARWRRTATGLPWGVAAGTLSSAWLTPAPWSVVGVGLVVAAGLALLGMAVEARATGWGAGAVLLLALLHGLVLAALLLGQALG